MSPPRAGSSTSADLPAGTLIAGFRVERLLGHGSRATVYEATQLSLDRRVALKVMRDRSLSERVGRLTWPEHPGAVSLFGAGDSEHGPWLAMRLVTGGTLATRRAKLDAVEAALAHAHRQGIVHGDVTARNVLIDADGHAYLSDFGLAEGGATAADDRAALAALVRDRSPRRASARRVALAAGGGLAAVALGVVLVSAAGDDSAGDGAPPPVPAGATAVGSDLAAGEVESVDCDGRAPTGASPACTVSQRELGGRPVVVPADGTIVSWAVRGARGPLALQILRGRGERLVQVDRSSLETVPGPGPHAVPTELVVEKGDRVALEVSPAAAVGIRRSGQRASADRWFGPLVQPRRRPERPAGTGFDHELLLRVDIRPGARADPPGSLRGGRAERARAGRRIASRTVAVGGDEVRTVVCVVVGDAVALDLFDVDARLARQPLAGAHARGRLVALTAERGGVRVRWRNPGGRTISRRIAVTPGALR